jgi:hypothetical protein
MRVTWIHIAAVFLTGCAPHFAPQQATESVPAPPASKPTTSIAPAPIAIDPDREVLEAVFADLLTEKETPVHISDGPPPSIIFEMLPIMTDQTVVQVLQHHDEALWAKLSPQQLALAQEAADHLVQRLQRDDPFKPFEPTDERVKVYHKPPPATDALEALGRTMKDRPVTAWPPGFSTDHRFAVVKLGVPWSMHHADGLYLLTKEDGAWKVVLRQFIYYV